MPVPPGHLNSTGVLLEVGGVLPMIHGGEIQPTTSAVAASPAASGKLLVVPFMFIRKNIVILYFRPNYSF
jgi:hypothetical protein